MLFGSVYVIPSREIEKGTLLLSLVPMSIPGAAQVTEVLDTNVALVSWSPNLHLRSGEFL